MYVCSILFTYVNYVCYSTVPGIVTEVTLTCEVMDLTNQCTVNWDVSDWGRFGSS